MQPIDYATIDLPSPRVVRDSLLERKELETEEVLYKCLRLVRLSSQHTILITTLSTS